MTLVTVVIPTRNRPAELKRAIQSVLDQTYQDFEIVVVRDGLDEVTESVVNAFADGRIRVLLLPGNVGGSEARNLGVSASSARWIALLDDDDQWLPQKLERQIELAKQQENNDQIIGSRYFYSRPGHPSQIWPTQLPIPGRHPSEFIFASCGGFQTSTYLVSRQLLMRVPFQKGLKKHQDWDWFLRAVSLPEVRLAWVDEPLTIYWVPAPSSKSVSNQKDWRFSAAWAKENLSLMSRRAYSMFLVKICARGAAIEHASLRDKLKLLHEIQSVGHANLRLLGEFLVAMLVSDKMRSRIASVLMRGRNAKSEPSSVNSITKPSSGSADMKSCA